VRRLGDFLRRGCEPERTEAREEVPDVDPVLSAESVVEDSPLTCREFFVHTRANDLVLTVVPEARANLVVRFTVLSRQGRCSSVRWALHDALMSQWASTLLAALLAVGVGGWVTYLTQRSLDGRRMGNERDRDERRASAERARDDRRAEAERRRDERRTEVERERDAVLATAEFGVAMRLVLAELDTVVMHYDLVIREGRYPQAYDPARSLLLFPTDAWVANKRTLAAGLPEVQWVTLDATMTGAEITRVLVYRGTPGEPISAYHLHQMQNGRQHAHDVYVSLAGIEPPTSTASERADDGESVTAE
jgi:hypothetical protein